MTRPRLTAQARSAPSGRSRCPLAKPALATVSIFYFVWVWNDFLYPLLYLQKDTMSTIPMGLMLLQRSLPDRPGGMQTAALSIATFVPLAFYMRYMLGGGDLDMQTMFCER